MQHLTLHNHKTKKLTCEQSGDILDWLKFKSNTDRKLLDHIRWLHRSEGS